MRQYIALIHKDAGSDYGVSFPDLPGCVTAGRDLDEARRMAEEALALHLEGMAADRDPIPEPSSLEAIMRDRQNRDAVAILVTAPVRAAKAVRINVTVPEDDLAAIDRYAAEQGYTRSGFLVHAAKRVSRISADQARLMKDETDDANARVEQARREGGLGEKQQRQASLKKRPLWARPKKRRAAKQPAKATAAKRRA